MAGVAVGDRLIAVGAQGLLWASLKEAIFELEAALAEPEVNMTVLHGGAAAWTSLQVPSPPALLLLMHFSTALYFCHVPDHLDSTLFSQGQ